MLRYGKKIDGLCSNCRQLFAFLQDSSICQSKVVYDDPPLPENSCRTCMLFSHRDLIHFAPFEAECLFHYSGRSGGLYFRSLEHLRNPPTDYHSDYLMELRQCTTTDLHAIVKTDPERDTYRRHEVPITVSERPTSTGADVCIDTIRLWTDMYERT